MPRVCRRPAAARQSLCCCCLHHASVHFGRFAVWPSRRNPEMKIPIRELYDIGELQNRRNHMNHTGRAGARRSGGVEKTVLHCETNIRVNSFYKGRYLRACAPVLEQAPSSWSRPRGAEGNHLRNGVKSCFADGDVRRAHPHVHPLPAFTTHRP